MELEGFWLGVLLGALAAWLLPQLLHDARDEKRRQSIRRFTK